MTECKFLIAGDVNGEFETLFKKVSSVVKKRGPFNYLFCVGSFFGEKDSQWDHYIKKGLDIPLTVYILGPNSEKEREFYPDDLGKLSDINEKIIYLGKRGNYTTCEGLRIGYLSGIESKSGDDDNEWCFSERDVKCLVPPKNLSEGPVFDVLLTSSWPEGVSQLHKVQVQAKKGSSLLASSLEHLKPWYHFAGLEGVFYERAPYSNKSSNGELSSVTRFIALGSVEGEEKWLHAIGIKLPRQFSQTELKNLMAIMTPSPFKSNELRDTFSYRYDFSSNDSKQRNNKRKKGDFDRKKKMKIDAEKDCWFCLSSGKAENHLIISVGKHTYVSLNRGGLVSQHLNIFPIEHVASMSQASEAVLDDVGLFRSLLTSYFSKAGFSVLFFERYYKTFHSQIHCVPLLPEMIDQSQKVFVDKVEELGLSYELSKECSVFELPPEQNYFHVIFPNNLNLVVKIDSRFPLNFGRDVLVDKSLMNAEDKADWRNCVLTVEEESEIVRELRQYIKYD